MPPELPFRQARVQAAVLQLSRPQVLELGLDRLAGRLESSLQIVAHVGFHARGHVEVPAFPGPQQRVTTSATYT